MVVSAVTVGFVAEHYILGALPQKCLAVAASVFALLVGVSALRQMRTAEVSAGRKFAGLVVAAIVCMLVGVRVWPVLGPGATQALAEVPSYFTSKEAPASDEAKDTGAAASAAAPDPKPATAPAVSAPVASRPVLDVAALQARCDAWGRKAPRFARDLYAPDAKDEPGWIVEARELDYETTRSFEALKVIVDEKIRQSFATLSDKDKEYVDVIRKSWRRYEVGEYSPPYYDFNGVVVNIAPPNLDNHGISYLVSVLKARVSKLKELKAELSIVPGFSL